MDEEKKIDNEQNDINEEWNDKGQDNKLQEETKQENIVEIKETIESQSNSEVNIEDTSVNKKKRNIIIACVIFGIFFIGIFINIFTSKYENIVYPGLTFYGENISKLNKEELEDKLNEMENKINSNKITIKSNDKNYYIKTNDILLDYNTNELVDSIMKYGKDRDIFEKFNQIIMKKNKDFKFTVKIDESKVVTIIDEISNETSKDAKEPQVIINGDKISYVEGINGLKLDENLLTKDIENALKESSIVNGVVNIDAKYKINKPTIAISDLKDVNNKISTYSTSYAPGGGRGSNVENAAKKLDNMILMPGQEFSYEHSVGPVVESNGYTYAPVISNGELVQGIGGGVCQVSSTLYNTMLKAGILPTERRNHSKAVNYVPRGLDATLASGSIDYKFKNTLTYPIVINASWSGGMLTIEFWSNKDALKGIEYKPVSYARGNSANTYLYGYDKEGNKIYEKHIDTSIYK